MTNEGKNEPNTKSEKPMKKSLKVKEVKAIVNLFLQMTVQNTHVRSNTVMFGSYDDAYVELQNLANKLNEGYTIE